MSTLLVRTASRCRKAYILLQYRCGFFFLLSFFLFSLFSTPNLWSHWTDLNQTWTHIQLWLLFEKFDLNSTEHLPPRAGRNYAFWDRLCNLTEHICAVKHNETHYQQLERNLLIYRTPLHDPLIWWTLLQKRLRTVGEVLPTP